MATLDILEGFVTRRIMNTRLGIKINRFILMYFMFLHKTKRYRKTNWRGDEGDKGEIGYMQVLKLGNFMKDIKI